MSAENREQKAEWSPSSGVLKGKTIWRRPVWWEELTAGGIGEDKGSHIFKAWKAHFLGEKQKLSDILRTAETNKQKKNN